ncbi:ABC-type amino acid transport substrate-binding protein [Hydrogenophaga palleronii]|uniref:ABC-type amino acid transport substrate-binding protein n=1 Tax=Hydrogenophaga palleronii TaxID=65655 RepID=A0ABU1WPV6_9BURK|nr:ABC transporter substrate-binding protein [Hydrogenophaga palleronii]MDR7151330.1 ABC-type amino acid transport substrate-binding protein [Hydrogenophaga palleronii]
MSSLGLLRFVLGFLASACLSHTAYADDIVVYGDDAYAPVSYLDGGKPAGVFPAIFNRLSRDTGDRYEFVLLPWNRALRESRLGGGGIGNFSWNEERDKLYDFSEPIYSDDIQLVVLKGKEFAFAGVQDLKGKTAGGALGASYGEEIDRAIADGVFSVDRDDNQRFRMRKLLAGRIDVAIVGNGTAGFELLFALDPKLKAMRNEFVVLPHPLTRDPLHVAFAKSMNMKPALERLNRALSAFKQTAEYQEMVKGEVK